MHRQPAREIAAIRRLLDRDLGLERSLL